MHEAPIVISTPSDTAVARSAAFLEEAFPRPRSFAIRLWDGTTLPADGTPRFTLLLHSPGALRRMFKPPVELSMGEAYLRREFDIEGDLTAAFEVVPSVRRTMQSPRAAASLAARWLALPSEPAQRAGDAREPALLAGEERSPDRDRSAIRYHYDVGNDFYQLFLDRRMIYSCAYFETGREDLDGAQEAKLEHICRKLRLREGETLLDIGCGWGGLLIYAAERYGVSGMGVTLSAAQLEMARQRIREAGLEERVRVEGMDYRQLAGERFDKVVSVGMFEHVGRKGLREYFAKVGQLLRPGGLFLNHAISERAAPAEAASARGVGRRLEERVVGRYAFRNRYIFPDAELMPLSEANLEAERAGFEVRDVENLREHYSLTLRHWLDRLRQRRSEAVRLAGEPIYRLWELYLASSIYHFDTGRIAVNQSLLASPLEGRVPLPLSRADLYAR